MKAPASTLAEAKAALLAMTEEAAELKDAAGGSITEAVADWLAPQYALAARERLAATEGAERFQILRAFVEDWALLRRGHHQAGRLQIEREQLELDREQSNERMEKLFWEWAQKPENRDRICRLDLSLEEKQARIREIFGLDRAPAPETARKIPAQSAAPGGISAETRRLIEEQLSAPSDPTQSD